MLIDDDRRADGYERRMDDAGKDHVSVVKGNVGYMKWEKSSK